jgi:hypothetical protein
MDFETAIFECIRLTYLLKDKLPRGTKVDTDVDQYQNLVDIYINPNITVSYQDQRFDISSFGYHSDERSEGSCLTVDDTLHTVINLVKTMDHFISKYRIEELEKKLAESESNTKKSIELEEKNLSLLIDILVHSNNGDKCLINRSSEESDIDYLHKLQDGCLKILSDTVEYHPASDTVDELRKDFENLSTQISKIE